MDIVLYYSPIACSLVPYVTLTEAGADFEVRNINLRKGQQSSPAYLKLNPKHKVPVLMVDGQVLTENVAIQLWIARNFPEAKLLPTDPWQELKAISIMSWCASGIHPFLARTNARTQFELDLTRYTNCQAHYARLQTRPSVQQCLAYEKSVQAEFAKAA